MGIIVKDSSRKLQITFEYIQANTRTSYRTNKTMKIRNTARTN